MQGTAFDQPWRRGLSVESKTYTTALVIIPPETVWPSIQALRQKHDRQLRRWMPHITLLYPFRPRQAFGQSVRLLLSACKDTRGFEVSLDTFSYFEHSPGLYTAWLAPEPREPIVELQDRLLGAFPDCDEVTRFENGYKPHLSIGQVRGRATLERLLPGLQQAWRHLEFTVSCISLICRGDPPDDVFRVDRVVPLG